MSDEIEAIKNRALQLAEVAYKEVVISGHNEVNMFTVGSKLNPPLHRDNFYEEEEFRKLAGYLANSGYIEGVADGLLIFRFTPKGIAWMKGEGQQQPQSVNQTFHVESAPGAAFGSWNVTINNALDMRSVKAELDRAELEAAQLNEPDAAQVKELIAVLREHLSSGEPLEAGKLAKYWDIFQRYAPILVNPVVGALVTQAFNTALG